MIGTSGFASHLSYVTSWGTVPRNASDSGRLSPYLEQLGNACPHSGWQWAQKLRRRGEREEESAVLNFNLRDRKMARLEAVLLVADGALTYRRLAQLATLADAGEARELIARLNRAYDQVDCAFRVERVATGCRLMTRPAFARWLDRLHNRQAMVKLSPAMMETLAMVAYRQPITRAEIEKIRGVQSAEMLKQLMERGYVRITGEDDSLGRPFLYGTTRAFLEAFGLKDLDSLPMAESLRRLVQKDDAETNGESESSPLSESTADLESESSHDPPEAIAG